MYKAGKLLYKIWLNINTMFVSVIIKLPHQITNFMLSYLNPRNSCLNDTYKYREKDSDSTLWN